MTEGTCELARTLGLGGLPVPGLVRHLASQGLTVAAAESLTAGLVTAVLTEVPGSSAVVRGGLVVYATDLKHTLAGVDRDLLEAGGPVQPEVAVQLARGAGARCGASIGLGLTGVAGPDPQAGVAVGTWYVAAVHGGGVTVVENLPPDGRSMPAGPLPGRSEVRAQCVAAAIRLLAEVAGFSPP